MNAKTIVIETQCPSCAKFTNVTVETSQDLGNTTFDEAFPTLAAAYLDSLPYGESRSLLIQDREMLITGLCHECFKGLMNQDYDI